MITPAPSVGPWGADLGLGFWWRPSRSTSARASTAWRRCFRWGLFDRAPMPRWSDGLVTLLGDACHPMLPFMAQGAVMAIEDAYTLARCLAANRGDKPAAICRYECLRRERTAAVQRISRDNISFFHNADLADLGDRLERHRQAHLWLYGFDVTHQDFEG